ncbi:MAG: SRPBCC family protein [Candidatus Methylacidiphilales bacterium]
MWIKTYSTITKNVTHEQMWRLFADVNNWHKWDHEIEYAKLEGNFKLGNYFILKPKGSPKVKIELIEVLENKKFVDLTKFPLAKMYGEHVFEQTAEGLKITTTMKVTGLLSFLWIKLVAQNIVNGLPTETQNQIKYAAAHY